jgi:hypothetical protein
MRSARDCDEKYTDTHIDVVRIMSGHDRVLFRTLEDTPNHLGRHTAIGQTGERLDYTPSATPSRRR